MTMTGNEVVSINQAFSTAWAFAHDDQRLAYSQAGNAGVDIFVFDLREHTNQLIGTIPTVGQSISTLYWRGDDRYLIADEGLDNDPIWMIEVKPNSTAEWLIDAGFLIEVVNVD